MTRDAEFARLVRERVTRQVREDPRHPRTCCRARRGRAPDPGLPAATVATDLLRNEFLLFGAPVDDEIITDIVDEVYLPLVRKPE